MEIWEGRVGLVEHINNRDKRCGIGIAGDQVEYALYVAYIQSDGNQICELFIQW